jgi:hypothetical protein
MRTVTVLEVLIMAVPIHRKKQVAIVGAGLAGLSAARRLQRECPQAEVTVFEKSRSFGGRCASRKFHEHIVDHGAQYFTISEKPFREFIEELPEGDPREIPLPIRDFDGNDFKTPKGARYYIRRGNNTLGREPGAKLEVRRERHIQQLRQGSTKPWALDGEEFDAVLLTTPLPQMAQILSTPDSGAGARDALAGYLPNLTGFFEYQGEPHGLSTERYALVDLNREETHPLAWSACENAKDGRIAPGKTVYVAQASGPFSQEYLEADPQEWLPRLRDYLEEFWRLDPQKRGRVFGHRWRYARVAKSIPLSTIAPGGLPPGVFAAGDFQAKSRVEAAWMTGWHATERIRRFLGI